MLVQLFYVRFHQENEQSIKLYRIRCYVLSNATTIHHIVLYTAL